MSNVIRLCDMVPVDPVLRKGDLVKLVDMELFVDTGEDNENQYRDDLEGAYAIVTSVEMVFPSTHELAPGQASYVCVAIPFEEGWEEVDSISIDHIHRVLSKDSLSIRGYESE